MIKKNLADVKKGLFFPLIGFLKEARTAMNIKLVCVWCFWFDLTYVRAKINFLWQRI